MGACGTSLPSPIRAGLTLALIIVRVEVDGEVVGDLEGERGGGSRCSPTRHGPWHVLSPTGAMAKGAWRDEGIPGIPWGLVP